MTKNSKQLIVVGFIAFAFIVLKLFKVFSWGWWWILAPLWLPAVAGFISLAVYYSIKYRTNPVKSKWIRQWFMIMYQIIQESKNISSHPKN